MMILLHICIALTSMIISSYAFFKPSKRLLGASYGFIAGTFATGFYLVITAPAHMLQTCMVGLGYLGVVLLATLGARAKLARRVSTEVDEA